MIGSHARIREGVMGVGGWALEGIGEIGVGDRNSVRSKVRACF